MPTASRPKQPVDVLQGMINGILIEVGRALRISDKEGGKTLANGNARLRSNLPGAVDHFHQALDELECDIVRAKAVFLRDLDELQAQRLALENLPSQAVETATLQDSMPAEDLSENIVVEDSGPTPQPTVKEEDTVPHVAKPDLKEVEKQAETSEPMEDVLNIPEKGLQGLSPPSSMNDINAKSNAAEPAIDTTTAIDNLAFATSGPLDSSIDLLFDKSNDSNNNSVDMTFDSMEFLNSGNTQEQSEFDLSTFGATSQDFNMVDLHTSNDGGNINEAGNKQDDIFGLGNTDGGGDMMDLSLDMGTAGANDSVFDDIYFVSGDDGNTGDGGEMEHGAFDNAFFGLE